MNMMRLALMSVLYCTAARMASPFLKEDESEVEGSRLRLVAYLISIPPPGVSSPVGGVPGMFRPGADPGVIERDLNIQSGPGNGISGITGGCD